MAIDIQRVPWRRGSTPQWDGVGWHQAAKPTSNQFWVFNGTTGLWAARSIIAADLPSHTHTAHDNRARLIHFDLGAGQRVAGTGAWSFSAGGRISYPDAEGGSWSWGSSTPADVAGGGTLYWLWETPATGALVARWTVIVGQTGDGVASSSSNMLSLAADYAIDGTTTLQQLSSVDLTTPLVAGQSAIQVLIERNGANAADTVSDVCYIRAIWISYTADM